MDYAVLSGRQFIAEKERNVVITTGAFQVDVLDENRVEAMKKHWNDLTIPKRPKWNETTTKEELEYQERTSFLEWRRGLAKLEENKHLLMTPFEKNLEIWRQLWRVVERSSLVVQIVDARHPLLFRCVDLENWVTSFGPSKRNLLLVNKADYLSEKQREIWAEYFNKENINFVFFSAKESTEDLELDTERNSGVDSQKLTERTNTSKIFTRTNLLHFLIEKCKEIPKPEYQPHVTIDPNAHHQNEDKVMVGMVGYPNVGKSSTINALLGKKRVAVSKTPGKTKHFQTLLVDDTPSVILCDCPGLVFPSFMATRSEMVCNGLLRIAEIRDVLGPVRVVCKYIPRNILEKFYRVNFPSSRDPTQVNLPVSPEEFLSAYAFVRGYLSKYGQPDIFRAGKVILNDFVDGKLLYCHGPPDCDNIFYKSQLYILDDSSSTSTPNNITTTTTTTSTQTDNTVKSEKEDQKEGQTEGQISAKDTENNNEDNDDEDDDEEEEGEGEEGEDNNTKVEPDFSLEVESNVLVNETTSALNYHHKAPGGRKHVRRERQKAKLDNESGAYVAGKKHKNFDGAYSKGRPQGYALPTNIKL
eukprot:TRINITY_DN1631_c0_g1_i1.p1 TRINITY_DN1631_c0_g1~~TRINITY_DN1631_c0_g1_i1.p1  ORF type:complete len:650 (+),score=181.73 TRINITY_DN1631_c0_g1_i1:196-1950(+)